MFCRAFKDNYKKSLEIQSPIENLEDLLNYDPKLDLFLGGALKTLIPDMEFGGYESLFFVWMFVKTPQDRMFPATLYYGHSAVSVGAWSPNNSVFLFKDGRDFPQEFQAIINFTPFDFSVIERDEFIEALKFSLAKVPISDFEGVFQDDFGSDLMGVKSGRTFIKSLENNLNNTKK